MFGELPERGDSWGCFLIVLSVGYEGVSGERQTMYVVVLMVFSSDAGSNPAISTLCALVQNGGAFILSSLQLNLKVGILVSTFQTRQMTEAIEFTKASGAGNDFVLINNMNGQVIGDRARLAKALCSRNSGIGADGLILLEKSDRADFLMTYYNTDGSYGGMCGNGGRCVARFAHILGLVPAEMRFEALEHVYRAQVNGDTVRLHMKDPVNLKNLDFTLSLAKFQGHFIDTGSPHFVLFVDEISQVNVVTLGANLRRHEQFQPLGTNVNFVKVMSSKSIEIRTYERGVETETLACGTGSVASAIVSSLINGTQPPVAVRVRSGEELIVDFRRTGKQFTEVILEGSAHMVFSGSLQYDLDRHQIRDAAPVIASSQSMSFG